ncbi:unnamed protein product [Arabis nemorensis]|uniref:F-box associated beta-propeller type 3 domain-containing protein n=1 Tax=Arabis nemorensis TaxID=586526 RepID=A0A565BNL9_9BRAS|nr:unnamed protein product [Arabis nemorensis]
MFVERRMILQKSRRKILASYFCNCSDRPRLLPGSRLEGDEEIVYLHRNPSRQVMTCDGLVCLPDQDCVSVLNPSTGQLVRLPYGAGSDFILEKWVMGFGRDKVTGSYKVVKMCVAPMNGECDLLDEETEATSLCGQCSISLGVCEWVDLLACLEVVKRYPGFPWIFRKKSSVTSQFRLCWSPGILS